MVSEPDSRGQRDTATSLKVVLLGDSGVGKTCLRSQFVHHVFTNAYKATIGGDYLTTTMRLPAKKTSRGSELEVVHDHENAEQTGVREEEEEREVSLQIWDTAGQERFNSISKAFYRGTDVVVLVYDITNYESVLSVRNWFVRFMEHCHVEQPGVMIVGNKIDQTSERCVDLEEIREILTRNISPNVDDYVGNWDLDLKEVTSKRLDLVEQLFVRVAEIGVSLMELNDGSVQQRPRNIVGFDGIDLTERMGEQSYSSMCSC